MLLSVLKDVFFSKTQAAAVEALAEPPPLSALSQQPREGRGALPSPELPKTLADLLQDPAPLPPGSIQLDENLSLVRGRHGLFLANRFDHHVGCALDRYGECREIQLRLLDGLVSEGATVVEVGASIGAHSVPLARKIGPNGRLFAIEPQPVIAQALAANVALNSLENVSVLNRACGAQPSTRWMPAVNYFGGAFHNSSQVNLAEQALQGAQPVDLVPLNTLLADVPSISLLRVEVSGMELEVLQGASKWLDLAAGAPEPRPAMYVANSVVERSPALIEHILALGYRLWWHLPSLYNPQNHFERIKNDYDDAVDVCMVCLPADAPIPPELGRLTPVGSPTDHPLKPQASAAE